MHPLQKDYPFDTPKVSPGESSLASVALRVSFPMHPKQKKYLQMANGLTNLSLWFHRDLDSVSPLSNIKKAPELVARPPWSWLSQQKKKDVQTGS